MDKQELIVHVKGVEPDKRVLTAYGNTKSGDRDGEQIKPSAFSAGLAQYMKNPVIIAGHTYRTSDGTPTVIGKTIWAHVDDNGLLFSMQFANTELANEYWDLYRDGFMRAFSVGFIPKKWQDKNASNAEQFAPGVSRLYDEVELMEISAVAVPSNRESLVLAAKDGSRLAEQLVETLGEPKAEEPPLEPQEAKTEPQAGPEPEVKEEPIQLVRAASWDEVKTELGLDSIRDDFRVIIREELAAALTGKDDAKAAIEAAERATAERLEAVLSRLDQVELAVKDAEIIHNAVDTKQDTLSAILKNLENVKF